MPDRGTGVEGTAERFSLSPDEVTVLRIANTTGMKIIDCAVAAKLTISAVRRAARSLSARGYVALLPDQEAPDLIWLTDDGRQVRDSLGRGIDRALDRTIKSLRKTRPQPYKWVFGLLLLLLFSLARHLWPLLWPLITTCFRQLVQRNQTRGSRWSG